MDEETLYGAIFRRKSVRLYDQEPLPQGVQDEILKNLQAARPLLPGLKTEFRITPLSDTRSSYPMKKAPHYIGAYAAPAPNHIVNIGFILQQMDLRLSASGIGTCWQGIPQPKKGVLAPEGMDFVIYLAFGKPKEPLHRASASEFKREPMEEMTSATGAEELLEPVRLAPSAMNSQPWYFTGTPGLLHAYCKKPGMVSGALLKEMNQVDMGIALCHLWLSARHQGKSIEFATDEGVMNSPPKGYYYIISAKIG